MKSSEDIQAIELYNSLHMIEYEEAGISGHCKERLRRIRECFRHFEDLYWQYHITKKVCVSENYEINITLEENKVYNRCYFLSFDKRDNLGKFQHWKYYTILKHKGDAAFTKYKELEYKRSWDTL